MRFDVGKLMEDLDSRLELALSTFRKNRPIFVSSEALSLVGDYGLIWVLIAIVILIKKPRSIFTVAKLMAVSGFGSMFISSVLKQLIRRERPTKFKTDAEVNLNHSTTQTKPAEVLERAKWLRNPSSQSFPSGHTMAAFSTAFLIDDLGEFNGRLKLLAFLIGVSRVIVNDHYPTDVIAGGVLGILLAKTARKFLSDI